MLFYISSAIVFAGAVCCSFAALRRSLHMYQLSSYQNPSYNRFLRNNPQEEISGKRVFSLFLFFAEIILFPFLPLWGIFIVINRDNGDSKIPLKYTPRIKRLIITYGILSLLVFSPIFFTGGSILFSGIAGAVICLWIFFQPRLVMLYNLINTPLERRISQGFINDAKSILQSMPNLKIIGITGSYGKTSVKHFLNDILSVKYNVYMTPGNFNTTLGVVRAVREGLKPMHDVFICEMGARHRGDIKEICDLVNPESGIITYIGEQHLETFGSIQAISDTKSELAEAVEKNGTIFLNSDSTVIAEKSWRGRHIKYGSGDSCDYRLSDIRMDSCGSRFTVHLPQGHSQDFQTQLLGMANIQNLCGAIAAAHYYGVPPEKMPGAVARIKSTPHRLELKTAGDMTIIDDAYNSNPRGARVALDVLGSFPGCRIVITPGLIELGDIQPQSNIQLGEYAAGSCDYIVTVGSNPGKYVAEGARGAGFEVHEAATFLQAMDFVRSLDATDKVVLLLNDLPDNYN